MDEPSFLRRSFPWLFAIGLFLLWEILCRGLGIADVLLPKPTQVLAVLYEKRAALAPLDAHSQEHNMNLKGKTLFITGASRGIGLACARAFKAEGARVAAIELRDAINAARGA